MIQFDTLGHEILDTRTYPGSWPRVFNSEYAHPAEFIRSIIFSVTPFTPSAVFTAWIETFKSQPSSDISFRVPGVRCRIRHN
jgi:hypothetical protein